MEREDGRKRERQRQRRVREMMRQTEEWTETETKTCGNEKLATEKNTRWHTKETGL